MNFLDFVILGFIALNVLISMSGFTAFQGQGNAENFLFIPYQVKRGENLTGLVLSNFSHANLAHLALNMLAFYFFAGPVLYRAGIAGFFFILLGSAIGADLYTYFRRRDDASYRCLGASGYVSGLVFAAIVFEPGISIFLLFIPIPIPGPVFAVLFLLGSYLLMKRGSRGIGHESHIGGAVAGFLSAVVISERGLWPLIEWALHWFR
ncbi:MAG: rhomboid family intramembrane serine protease [Leptospiraceae bacterium]|nr:rhomboid family intramembrane serine protease [Leptospiraceae bacterium]MCP5484126.1 rhomboid family intramembrane serine protease [Spirochaetales bacterium]